MSEGELYKKLGNVPIFMFCTCDTYPHSPLCPMRLNNPVKKVLDEAKQKFPIIGWLFKDGFFDLSVEEQKEIYNWFREQFGDAEK